MTYWTLTAGKGRNSRNLRLHWCQDCVDLQHSHRQPRGLTDAQAEARRRHGQQLCHRCNEPGPLAPQQPAEVPVHG